MDLNYRVEIFKPTNSKFVPPQTFISVRILIFKVALTEDRTGEILFRKQVMSKLQC
jgi:hypothetical protein